MKFGKSIEYLVVSKTGNKPEFKYILGKGTLLEACKKSLAGLLSPTL